MPRRANARLDMFEHASILLFLKITWLDRLAGRNFKFLTLGKKMSGVFRHGEGLRLGPIAQYSLHFS